MKTITISILIGVFVEILLFLYFFIKKRIIERLKYLKKVISLYESKKYEEAEEFSKKALKSNQNIKDIYIWLGRIFLMLGKFKEAQENYFVSITMKANYRAHDLFFLFFSCGEINKNSDKFLEFIEEFKKIINREKELSMELKWPYFKEWLINLMYAWIYYKKGIKNKAYEYFKLVNKDLEENEMLLQADISSTALYYYMLGELNTFFNNKKEAIEYFKKSQEKGGRESFIFKRVQKNLRKSQNNKDNLNEDLINIEYKTKCPLTDIIMVLREENNKDEVKDSFGDIENFLIVYNFILSVLLMAYMLLLEERYIWKNENFTGSNNKLIYYSIARWLIVFLWLFVYKWIRKIAFNGVFVYGKEFNLLHFIRKNAVFLIRQTLVNVAILFLFVYFYSNYRIPFLAYSKVLVVVAFLVDLTIYGISYLIINFIINSIVKWKSDEKEEKLSGIDELRRYYLDYEIPLKLSVILGVICLFVFFITGVRGAFFLTEYIAIHFILFIFGIWHMRKKRLKVSEIIIKSILIFIPYGIFIAIYTPSKRVEKGERIFSL